MPEISIDEDGKFLFWKEKVRSARQLASSTPAGDFEFPHHPNEPQFCCVVSRAADSRHVPRTFFRFETICHAKTLEVFFFASGVFVSFARILASSELSILIMSV